MAPLFCHSPYLSLLHASLIILPTRTLIGICSWDPGIIYKEGTESKQKILILWNERKGREAIYKICEGDADFEEKMIELQHLNWDGFKILHIWLQKLSLSRPSDLPPF